MPGFGRKPVVLLRVGLGATYISQNMKSPAGRLLALLVPLWVHLLAHLNRTITTMRYRGLGAMSTMSTSMRLHTPTSNY